MGYVPKLMQQRTMHISAMGIGGPETLRHARRKRRRPFPRRKRIPRLLRSAGARTHRHRRSTKNQRFGMIHTISAGGACGTIGIMRLVYIVR